MEGSALLYRGFFVCERKSVSARRGCSVEEDPRNNAATKNRTGTVRLGGGRPKDGDEGESEGRTEEVAGATGEGGGKFWGRQVLSVPWLWLRRWALVSAAAGGRPQDFFSLWGGGAALGGDRLPAGKTEKKKFARFTPPLGLIGRYRTTLSLMGPDGEGGESRRRVSPSLPRPPGGDGVATQTGAISDHGRISGAPTPICCPWPWLPGCPLQTLHHEWC